MKDTLRIGYVCFGSYGGSGVIASELALGMARRGHHVHVIASTLPPRLLGEAQAVFFHQVSTTDYPVLEQAPYALAVASKIVEAVNDHSLDLVHAHYAVPHATSAFLAQQVLGPTAPRMICTLHGTDVTQVGVDPSIQSINRFSVTALDGVTVPSEFLRSAAHTDLAVPQTVPIQVVPNFVDTDHFRPAEPRERSRLARWFEGPDDDLPVLIHVSNFRSVKRVPDVVAAFARLNETLPARLLLVGDGPERARTAQRVRNLDLARKVSFVGTLGEVAEVLRHADLFLLASETESFGLAALEAAASGLPVVAYRVGGVPEVVVDGETGLLVPPLDPPALARAAQAILQDPERQRAMGEAARRRAVEHFGMTAALDRYEALYRRCMGG
ncbi:MAG: N-acetyl-alpha-D-glucosaminyl L-malate synthase BshA [Myxococcales bacterium]|nr:N-acetyl-alpha-D-glucosaminyl L-malate synthase BshA [Myxococcales bacterium]